MGTRGFDFSGQHRLESRFLIEWSQTCYIINVAHQTGVPVPVSFPGLGVLAVFALKSAKIEGAGTGKSRLSRAAPMEKSPPK